jgi:hypothetical protein
MARILTKLKINEVSSVDKGAGEGVKVMLYKRDNTPQGPLLFNDIMRKADDEPADKLTPKLRAMIAAMRAADPTKSEEEHLNRLLTKPHGRRTAEHLNNLSKGEQTPMPQVDIAKLLEITEHGLNAQVTPRDGESFAKAFSRKYETDESYRRQWQNHQDTKMMLSMSKRTNATMTPTSTEVGNTLVADDSAEAVRLLTEMAEQTGKSFEVVFAAPENKALAARTYRMEQRPNFSSVNTDYLEA